MNAASTSTQRRSLSRTLPMAVLLFSIVPLVIAGSLSLAENAQRLRVEQERRTRQTAVLLAGRVRQLMLSVERMGGMLAGTPGTLDLISGANPHGGTLYLELRSLVRSHPELDGAHVLDSRGRPLLSYPGGPRMRVPSVPSIGGAPLWRPRSPDQGADMLLPLPVPSAGAAPAGWIALGVSPAALADSIALPEGDPSEVQAVLSVAGSGTAVATLAHPAIDEDDALVSEAPVHALWQVRAAQSLATYRALVREDLLRFGAVALVVSCLSAWVAWRYARALARDVRGVARSARAILKGHYLNAHVELQRDDELGLLSQSFNHMSWELEKRERERDVFGRLVSPEVRDQLLQGELILGGYEVEVTVLLSDIRGFTQLCEEMKPRDIVLTLNEYFTRMTEAVQRYGGYVNNFMGDAMVVVFGAPKPDEHRVVRALYAAVAMQRALDDFNRERATYDAPTLVMGIGLASGTALAGQIGSPERCIYTVIGDTVNVAARLESLSKEHPDMAAFANPATRELLPADLQALLTPMGERYLKGRDRSVDVYALPREAELPPPPAHLMRAEEEVL
ncbi:HAMP domain-containing protein [Aquabacterium sp. A7-Y]|uniref:adenylate/guanylate cyclase domain-containing protein n=1 Tax=Aquabacterium sp. A7-Y TaxID=1349605 RepID=UPI00223E80B7|nr:adenylate/guanylate cyclase domain-containing protein [Aquabacterium sp. A7-Y]MCW7539145.1 HAMP domain-containing protein [Aquabacterium sp. A7-Y]